MKKGVVMLISVILLVCFSFIVNGLTDLTVFNDTLSSKLLDFSTSRSQSVYVNLSSDAYVINTSLTLTGLLSDWETVYSYTGLNAPVSGKQINSSAWLITDESTDKIYLINPTDNSTIQSSSGVTFIDPTDAERFSADLWLVADYLNDRVVLYNLTGNSVVWNYSINRPTDVDVVSQDSVLISSYTSAKVELVNISTKAVLANVTSNINRPYDAEYVSSSFWIISDDNNRVKGLNPSSDSILWQFTINTPRDVDYLGNNISLIVSDSIPTNVFMFNFSDGNYLRNYTGATEPHDVDYISDTEWLITDKSGIKRVSLEKKYYPNNLNFTIGSTNVNYWSGKFNSTVTETGFVNGLNIYLNSCGGSSCDIPMSFSSSTSGKLNLTLLNVTYNRKPALSIEEPAAGDAWTNINNLTWNMTDGDGDVLTALIGFYNCTDWIDVNQTSGVPGIYNYPFDTSGYDDNTCYRFRMSVNDSYNNATAATGNFRIDNSNPLIWNLRSDDADNITRSDAVLNFRVEANDTFLQNVTLNGSGMALETGTTYLNITTAATLGCLSGANNSCSLTALATDIVNRQNSTSLTIVIDDVKPNIRNLNSSENDSQADKDDWVNFTVEVSDPNILSVVLGSSAMTDADNDDIWELYIQPVSLGCSAGSTCTLTANATDRADNSNTTSYNLGIDAEFSGTSSGGGSSGSGAKALCNNGKDDDGDGKIDLADPGCDSLADNDESDSGNTCQIEWQCGEWGECVDGTQSRVCNDLNKCGRDYLKPETEQTCVMAVTPAETFEVSSPSQPPAGVGGAISLFDRVKGNWMYIGGALAVIGGLALVGWRKKIFKK